MDKSTRLAASVLLLCGVLVLYNGFMVLNAQHYTRFPEALTQFLLGIVVFGLGFLFGTQKVPAKFRSGLDRISASLRIRPDQLIMLVLSVVLGMIAQTAAGMEPKMTSPVIAVVAWAAALMLVVAGGWKEGEGGKLPPGTSWRARLELPLSLLGIFLFAFILRFIRPETIPIILTGDEGSSGMIAALYARGELNNLFRTEWYAFPSLYFTIPGLFIRLFGTTVTALRLSSAIPGALTVAAAYVLVRAAFGNRAAWSAAIFLGTLHFHVHFSRIALNNIWDGLWITVALGALWYAWSFERRNAYILAGLSLGLSQFFYTSGHILPLIMLAWLLVAGLSDRGRFKHRLPDLGLMLLTAVVVSLPLIVYYAKFPLDLLAPMQRVSILSGNWIGFTAQSRSIPTWQLLLEQVWLGVGVYVYVPLRAWYQPDIPILRPIAAVFFVIGLIFCLSLNTRKFGLLLVLWLVAFGLLGALSESTPAAQRYPAAAPAAAALVAAGVDGLGRLFEGLWPALRRLVAISLGVVILVLAGREIQFYFFEYTPRMYEVMATDNGMVGYQLGLYLRQRPPNAQVVFLGRERMGFYSIPSTQFLAPQFQGIDIPSPWGSPENPRPEKDHLLFVILPHLEQELPLIKKDYPGGILTKTYAVDGSVLFYVYEYNSRSPQ